MTSPAKAAIARGDRREPIVEDDVGRSAWVQRWRKRRDRLSRYADVFTSVFMEGGQS